MKVLVFDCRKVLEINCRKMYVFTCFLQELMENGIIGNTGRKIIVENEDGEKKEMLEPESIHTYAGWKAIGRQVKKGEKCIATFMIWKHTTKKKKSESEDEDEQEKMFMTKAFFFRECQTEAVTEGA